MVSSINSFGSRHSGVWVVMSNRVLRDIYNEKEMAVSMHGPFTSCHEAMSVLEEEVFEVRMEVYKKAEKRDAALLYGELIQVGAMALKWAEQIRSGELVNDK